MENAIAILIQVLALAALGEALIEFFVSPWFDLLKERMDETARVQVLRWLSGAVGVAIAFNYALTVGGVLGIDARWAALDTVLLGLLIGRGSNAVHEWIKRLAEYRQLPELIELDET